MTTDPIALARDLLEQRRASEPTDATAMTLATADAEAADPPDPVLMADMSAQGPERRGGAQHVLAGQKPGDGGLAQRHGAEHQRPVRHRLIAGRAGTALQPGDRVGDQFGGAAGGRQGKLLKEGQKCGVRPLLPCPNLVLTG